MTSHASAPVPGPADRCDWCGTDVPYHVLAYLIPTGETLDGLPVVKLKCRACMDGQA